MQPHPHRPLGVTVTAVAAIGGSVLWLATAIWMVVSLVIARADMVDQALIAVFAAFLVAMIVVLAVWSGATAVGLFRLKGWARGSILAFSGLVILLCGSLVSVTLDVVTDPTLRMPFDREWRFKLILAGIQVLLMLAAFWWLVYFNRPGVRDVFGGELTAPNGRPFTISLTAWLLLIGSAFYLMEGVLVWTAGMPILTFGLILTGSMALLYNLALSAWSFSSAWGLLKLTVGGWWSALIFFVFNFASVGVSLFWPGVSDRWTRAVSLVLGEPATAETATLPSAPAAWISTFTAMIFLLVPIWFLVRDRLKFRNPPQAARGSVPAATG